MDLTVLVLQAGSLATFSSRISLLACPTPVYIGTHHAFPTLPPPPLTLRTKVPQQSREDDEWCGIVWSGVGQWKQSGLCARGILASLALVVFELCRRVRLFLFLFHFPLLFHPYLLFTLPRELTNEQTART